MSTAHVLHTSSSGKARRHVNPAIKTSIRRTLQAGFHWSIWSSLMVLKWFSDGRPAKPGWSRIYIFISLNRHRNNMHSSSGDSSGNKSSNLRQNPFVQERDFLMVKWIYKWRPDGTNKRHLHGWILLSSGLNMHEKSVEHWWCYGETLTCVFSFTDVCVCACNSSEQSLEISQQNKIIIVSN